MADVTVYTKSNCPQCVSTKNLMGKLGVAYDEVNIESDPAILEELKAAGHLAAPVVVTPDASWSGFQEAKIRDLVATTDEDDDWDF